MGLGVALLLSLVAFRGWIPADEGTLGLAAVRVLNGDWPHFDFQDVYSGLQAVLHAGVFAILGVSIRSLRIAWLGIAAVGAISIFFLLRHRLSHSQAALGAVSLTVWSFAMYPASMPTWWNLSLGLVAIAMVYSGWKRGSNLWVVVSGLITGVSVLIKTTGGAFVAVGILLWLLSVCRRRQPVIVYVAALSALTFIIAIIASAFSWTRVLLLGVPASTAVVLLWYRGRRPQLEGSNSYLPWLYTVGVALPTSVVCFIYTLTGRLDSLVTGWVVAPALRLDYVAVDISEGWILPGLAAVVLVLLAMRVTVSTFVFRIGLGLALLLFFSQEWALVGVALLTLLVLFPPALAAGIVMSNDRGLVDELSALSTATALMFALVSIPWWGPYYVAYTIPLLGVSVLLLIPSHQRMLAVAALCLLAGGFLVRSLTGYTVGPVALSDPVTYVRLENPRAGISVPDSYRYYDELTSRVAQLADGSAVYAGPDAPQVPFLAGVESATSAFYEVLVPGWDYGVLSDLARGGSVVVMNLDPNPSPPIPRDIRMDVLTLNPKQERYGPFLVTWSEQPERSGNRSS